MASLAGSCANRPSASASLLPRAGFVIMIGAVVDDMSRGHKRNKGMNAPCGLQARLVLYRAVSGSSPVSHSRRHVRTTYQTLCRVMLR